MIREIILLILKSKNIERFFPVHSEYIVKYMGTRDLNNNEGY